VGGAWVPGGVGLGINVAGVSGDWVFGRLFG